MKAGISTLAALAFIAAPAFAQEPSPPETQQSPAQSDQMTPPSATSPAPSATDPATPSTPSTPSTSPSMDRQAAAPSGDLREEENDDKMVPQLNASVDAVEDMDIYDASGKKIAEVDAVLVDANGNIKALVIEHGGFLGIGSREAIIAIEQVRTKDGNLAIDLTEEQLPTLPEWTR